VRRVDALASRDSAALAIWHLVVQYLLLGWPHHKRNKKPEQFYPKFWFVIHRALFDQLDIELCFIGLITQLVLWSTFGFWEELGKTKIVI
jgi:hypothetical protein